MTMRIEPAGECTVNLAGNDVDIVQSFIYLGANINSPNDMSDELRNRVMYGSRGQYALEEYLTRKMCISRALNVKV